MERYFEDFKTGDSFVSERMQITEEAILAFARQWDPQPFHVDPAFASTWTFGGLIASGLHTMAATLRLWLDLGVFRHCGLGSPGLSDVKFPRPVRPGDTLRVETAITDHRPSGSRPDRGLVKLHQVTRNQRDEAVLEQTTTVFLKRRPG